MTPEKARELKQRLGEHVGEKLEQDIEAMTTSKPKSVVGRVLDDVLDLAAILFVVAAGSAGLGLGIGVAVAVIRALWRLAGHV